MTRLESESVSEMLHGQGQRAAIVGAGAALVAIAGGVLIFSHQRKGNA